MAKKKAKAKGGSNGKSPELSLTEKRRHPRFLLSHEQFREHKTGKTYPVYDLSMNGLSIKIEKQDWDPSVLIPGILNLHTESVEISPRLVSYYGDRAALKIEVLSTYGRSCLQRALSPTRLGGSLKLVKEKVQVADFWYHGVCNTDVLIRVGSNAEPESLEVFFSNFYWGWDGETSKKRTGFFQSFGEKRQEAFLGEEPVQMEAIGLTYDTSVDDKKTRWAKEIVGSSPLDKQLKSKLAKIIGS